MCDFTASRKFGSDFLTQFPGPHHHHRQPQRNTNPGTGMRTRAVSGIQGSCVSRMGLDLRASQSFPPRPLLLVSSVSTSSTASQREAFQGLLLGCRSPSPPRSDQGSHAASLWEKRQRGACVVLLSPRKEAGNHSTSYSATWLPSRLVRFSLNTGVPEWLGLWPSDKTGCCVNSHIYPISLGQGIEALRYMYDSKATCYM